MAASPVVVKYVDLYDVLALGDHEIIVLEGGTPTIKSIDDLAAGSDLTAEASTRAAADTAEAAARASADTAEAAARAAGDLNAIGAAAGLALVIGG